MAKIFQAGQLPMKVRYQSELWDRKKTVLPSTRTSSISPILSASMKLLSLTSPSPSVYLQRKQPAATKLSPARTLLRYFLSHLATLPNIIKIQGQRSSIIDFEIEMLDFSRTFCDLHPNELVSNFCCKEECNVALCATCICTHTETHIQRRTAPDYQNIRTTYSKMQDAIRARISAFEHEKARINAVGEVIRNKRKLIGDCVAQARLQAQECLNRYFDAREKELLRKVEADEKKVGLHNENRLDALTNIISRDVSVLFEAAQEVNSQNFLESFHRIRTQILANSLQTQREISEELDKNESYDTVVTVNPQFVAEIRAALDKSLTLMFGEKRMQPKQGDAKETPKSNNSRVIVNPNEVSNLNVLSRRQAESQPKQTYASPRYLPDYAYKNPNPYPTNTLRRAPEVYYQPMPTLQSQIIPQMNYGSRMELRPNSSQKNIKQNISRQPLAQSFMQASVGVGQQSSKKIRRSGLTIFKAAQNDQKS